MISCVTYYSSIGIFHALPGLHMLVSWHILPGIPMLILITRIVCKRSHQRYAYAIHLSLLSSLYVTNILLYIDIPRASGMSNHVHASSRIGSRWASIWQALPSWNFARVNPTNCCTFLHFTPYSTQFLTKSLLSSYRHLLLSRASVWSGRGTRILHHSRRN